MGSRAHAWTGIDALASRKGFEGKGVGYGSKKNMGCFHSCGERCAVVRCSIYFFVLSGQWDQAA